MQSTSSLRSGASARLAERLAAARQQRFVGRDDERAHFRAALGETGSPVVVLYVYGPGGVGKTALLAEFARIAGERGLSAVRLDARDIEASPTGFLLGLRAALALGEERSPLEALAGWSRGVLLLDTYEAIAPLDAWLREVFLPQLPDRILVAIAGRTSPAPGWRTDPGWQHLVRTLPLRNLRPDESRVYLAAQGVPEGAHPAALAFTHGHPLALALVADLLRRGVAPVDLDPAHQPDVVRVLLERLVEHLPSPAHREAVEACAHTRVTTEAVLADVFGAEAAATLFAWLRDLSFVEHGPQGLFPHDLAREVIDGDLRWRNPEGYRSLHGRVRRHIVRRLQEARGRAQQQAVSDLFFLHRNSPLMRPYVEWQSLGTAYAEPASAADAPAILAMVRRHEGEDSARLAEAWLRWRPGAFLAFRGPGGEVIGFLATLTVEATPEELASDPALERAWSYAQRHGPPRPGEAMIYHRFMMDRDAYQGLSPAMNMVMMGCCLQWVTTPQLAWSFLAVADPDHWRPFFAYINVQRAPEADFVVGGRRFGVYVHDWRAEPPSVWLELMERREIATDLTPEMLEVERPAPLLVLSEPDFRAAVRQALRDVDRPAALARNPLLHSRVARDRAGGSPTAATLQSMLQEAAASLATTRNGAKFARALRYAYFEPVGSREAAAERLGLPVNTYRYQLAVAIERVTAWLWQRELVTALD
jgi:hypothetical protein